MTIEKADGDADDLLASRIAECIAQADARRNHVVAAHLDAALHALRGSGLESLREVPPRGKALH